MSPKDKSQPQEPETSSTIRVPTRLWLRLRGEAGSQGKSANEYINDLIRQALGEPETPPDTGQKGGLTYPLPRSAASSLCDR